MDEGSCQSKKDMTEAKWSASYAVVLVLECEATLNQRAPEALSIGNNSNRRDVNA